MEYKIEDYDTGIKEDSSYYIPYSKISVLCDYCKAVVHDIIIPTVLSSCVDWKQLTDPHLPYIPICIKCSIDMATKRGLN